MSTSPTITFDGLAADLADLAVDLTPAHIRHRLNEQERATFGRSTLVQPRFLTLADVSVAGVLADDDDDLADFDPFDLDADDEAEKVRMRSSVPVPYGAISAKAVNVTTSAGVVTLALARYNSAPAKSKVSRYGVRAADDVGIGSGLWSIGVKVKPLADKSAARCTAWMVRLNGQHADK